MRGLRIVSYADLAMVADRARTCTACRIADVRTNVVMDVPEHDVRVVFVVDQPSYIDDQVGTHLARPSSREVFNDVVSAMGIHAHEAHVTSSVKCRPRHGRSPFPDEIEACESFLFHELRMLQPEVVCPMGPASYRLVTGRPGSIGKRHGQVQTITVQQTSMHVVPLFGFAAAATNDRLRATLLADVREIGQLMRASNHPGKGVEDVTVQAAALVPHLGPDESVNQLALPIDGDERPR